uniref:Uncharacterized protein n=1 Tax=Romanomermis culicivorax TaxID=13658 RepID=A0A915IBR8_ROMCU
MAERRPDEKLQTNNNESLTKFWHMTQKLHFIQKEGQMGGVHGINYPELLSPETGDPLQDQRSDVRQNGRLLFLVRGTVVIAKVLIQGQ